MKRNPGGFVLFVAAVLLAETTARADPPRPNVLLIMADDLGFSDLGCYGGEIATPNLDSIAADGLRFSQFYNTARCWPSRSALLTGYYPQQIRRDVLPSVPGGGQGVRPDWAVLLPELLEPVGYRSYHTGKWHIDGMPIAEGFDRSYYLRDQGRFFNPTRSWKDDVKLPPVEKGADYYATTALADHAVEVLREHERGHADEPFFHYLAFTAPHFPLHALPEDIAVYEDTYAPGWDVIRAQRWRRMQQMGLLDATAVRQPSRVERDLGPPYHFPAALDALGEGEVNRPVPWQSLSDRQKTFQATKMAIHAAMIHRMDLEIGRVFDQIKEMGQWENTLVLFLSDNGASAEIMVRDDGHDPSADPGSAETYLCLGPGWSTTCNTPFRRHKTWTHEGGTSTPLLAAWPRGIKARGEIRRSPGHIIDIAATLLELTGAETAAEAPPAPGKSLVPAFSTTAASSEDAAAEPRTIWWFHDGHKAVRIGDWKAVAPVGEPWELYHLAADRQEAHDLAVPRADKLEELVTEWSRYVDEFTELASRDLPADVRRKARGAAKDSIEMKDKQAAGKPQR
ncbi:Arylsulfatase [Planctomycetes bacterium LzC2]|uniref:Arylsulfatase n=2 Tax=Alienimonas chondri TaxID=2681879 RepID=A0ABX1VFZ3_9PLAN|nr:Arylsulfatase [Alienimonas chondri]